jgi:hypothetical protein
VSVLGAALGLAPDVPGGRLTVAPPVPSPLGAVAVRGLRLGGAPLAVRVGADGSVQVEAEADVAVHLRS